MSSTVTLSDVITLLYEEGNYKQALPRLTNGKKNMEMEKTENKMPLLSLDYSSVPAVRGDQDTTSTEKHV